MRILGFSKHWVKLEEKEFTTFRFQRRDADWEIGEQVQIVYKPRTKGREILGVATIIGRNTRLIPSAASYVAKVNAPLITHAEVVADGFESVNEMRQWLQRAYGRERVLLMNKLTLRKIGDW